MAIIPSFFGEYAEQPVLQALIDDTATVLEGQTMWRTLLDTALPQASLTFENIIGRSRIESAASVVDIDAPAPLRSRNKLDTYTGKIPSMKEKFVLSQSELRELMALEESQLLNANGAVTALIQKLYDDTSRAAVAGDKRIDIFLMQMLSTLKVDISLTNNPDGTAYGEVDLLPAAYQAQGVPKTWDDKTALVIDDIENYIDFIRESFGRTFGVIRMSKPMWLKFKRNPQVIDRLKSFFNIGKSNGTYAATLANVNEMFTEEMWPTIEVIDKISAIEKDGKPQLLRPFNDNNLSFAPAGKIGTLKNAFPMERKKPIAGKVYADFGATMVSKWADDDPYREYTAMEMNAMPAIDIDAVYILQTNVQQPAFTGDASDLPALQD